MRLPRRFCAVLAGTVLFLAGFLKLMDPTGAALVMEDYLKFLHLRFLGFAGGFLSVFAAVLECVLGAALITGVYRRFTAAVSWVVMGFFTVLSLILLIFNPSMDCGCFGEAIHLTHWQTFLKNVILCLLIAVATIAPGGLGAARKSKYVGFCIAVVSILAFHAYSESNLPLMDFTSYAPGTELAGEMDVPESEPVMLVYEKNGKQGSFLPGFVPDSTWTFVREEVLSDSMVDDSSASVPLSFYNAEGEYCDSLARTGRVMIVSVHTPDELSEEDWAGVKNLVSASSEAGLRPVVLMASSPDSIASQVGDCMAPFCYCADRRTLLTLNRSNAGAVYVSDAEIIAKWPAGKYPSGDELQDLKKDSRSRLMAQGVLLYAFAVMLLL